MATTQDDTSNISRLLDRITATMLVDPALSPYAGTIEITVEGTRIVLRGELPTSDLKRALLPMIRRAGVLGQVCNCVVLGRPADSVSSSERS